MNTLIKQSGSTLLLLILMLVPMSQSLAHPGHADSVTISRTTHVYMQELIPHYLNIQKGLAAGELSAPVKEAAGNIWQLVKKARKKESDPSGKKMYKGVAKAAGLINTANDLKAAREAFDELNDILLPFFDNWPNHIKEHELVLYTCKETKQWWLQLSDDTAADPYRGVGITCVNLTEKEE